jgi:hypothetical protein
MSKLDKTLPKNATDKSLVIESLLHRKFGNHPAIILVGEDIQMFFFLFLA